MIASLFRRSKSGKNEKSTVPALYRAIVAQSRRAPFYAEWGIADSMTGRFDVISLHMCMVFRRLRGEGEPARTYAQELFDYFFQDMDRSLREMGVGDLSVGKRIAKMSELFYGLSSNVTEALDSGDRAALRGVIARNFFESDASEGVDPLTDYALDSARALDEQDAESIMAGRVAFAAMP